ncbi:Rieske domain-containing protein-like [Actinia tenebrosa]|uniref:Rieske domain-containing protein-like n=1 Tax=Actinia tenebrosa TaxID=6105 RepID=A0A6P8IIT4_ACTTE|nr:Rieske domain-containing protein-like [Actinia tenebrosa]
MAGENRDKDLYFQVEGIKYEDIAEMYDSEDQHRREKGLNSISIHASKTRSLAVGKEVTVNNHKIALLKYRGIVYAMDSKCPHMGGPLHLGDIEELGEAKLPCIVCPWHSWKYSLSTGEIKSPLYQNVKVTVYPVIVKDNGSLHVGFERISPDYFNCIMDF